MMSRTAGPDRLEVLDAHQHVWDVAARAQPWLDSAAELAPLRRAFSIADLSPLAGRAGVTGTVVVQTVTEPGETPELLALTVDSSLVVAVVGWTDLTSSAVAEDLAALAARPGGGALAGVRHPLLTEPDPGWLERADVRRGLAALAAAGLTFDLVLEPSMLPVAVRAAAREPALVFVLDHLGNVEPEPDPDQAWAANLAELAALPNTVSKLSGILGAAVQPDSGQPGAPAAAVARLRQYLEIALELFGPRRLMFGSDWPVCTLSAEYGEVVAVARELVAGLSGSEQAAILSGTASSVYRIPASRQPDNRPRA